ncbi:MAG TPA: hypothetical protein VF037_12630 [Gemmatimonadales bacterium]
MTLAAAVAIVAGTTAILRLVPGLLWPRHAMDGGYHMLLRREIRRNGMAMPRRVAAMALDEEQTYPWWYHWLLALFPERWLIAVPPLVSTLLDTAHAAIVVAIAAHLAPGREADTALLAGLLFATAPALLVVGIGPRAYEITPRPLGELCFTIVMAAGAAYHASADWIWLVAGILAGAVLLMSSKFAAQVLVFTVPVIAIAARSPAPLLLAIGAFGAALLLTRGRYRRVLSGQLQHLRIFRRRLQHEHAILRDRNRWGALAGAVRDAVRARGRDGSLASVARLAEHNTVLQFLLRNVLWCGAIVLLFVVPLGGILAEPAWGPWLVAWATAPLVPFAVSSLRRFRFLGEAERYPEYAVAAVAVLAALALTDLEAGTRGLLLAIYAASLVPVLGYSIVRQRWNARRASGPGVERVVSFLASLPPGRTILPVPWFSAYILAPRLEHRFLAGNDTRVWYRDYEKIFATYPWPVTDLAYWRARGAELALVDQTALGDADAPVYPLEGLPTVHADERFRVVRLDP